MYLHKAGPTVCRSRDPPNKSVLRIRIYYYADPGSQNCPYGSGSGSARLIPILLTKKNDLTEPDHAGHGHIVDLLHTVQEPALLSYQNQGPNIFIYF